MITKLISILLLGSFIGMMTMALAQCNVSCTTALDGTCASTLEKQWVSTRRCVNDPTQPPFVFLPPMSGTFPDFVGLSTFIMTTSGLDPGLYGPSTAPFIDVPSWVFWAQEMQLMNHPAITTIDSRITIDNNTLDIYVFRPVGSESTDIKSIVYLHGGAFQYLRAIHFTSWAKQLVRATGAAVILVDYNITRSPTTTSGFVDDYPVASKQTARAIRYLFNHASTLDLDPGQIFVAGDSAGANLAVSGLLRSRDKVLLKGCILLSPFLDTRVLSVSAADLGYSSGYFFTRDQIVGSWYVYAGGNLDGLQNDPYFNVFNLFAPGSMNMTGIPRTLVVGAQYDPIKEDGHAWSSLLRNAGIDSTYIEVQRLPHDGWFYNKLYPTESALVLGAINAFINY